MLCGRGQHGTATPGASGKRNIAVRSPFALPRPLLTLPGRVVRATPRVAVELRHESPVYKVCAINYVIPREHCGLLAIHPRLTLACAPDFLRAQRSLFHLLSRNLSTRSRVTRRNSDNRGDSRQPSETQLPVRRDFPIKQSTELPLGQTDPERIGSTRCSPFA